MNHIEPFSLSGLCLCRSYPVGDMATLRLRSVAISFDPINKGIVHAFRKSIEESNRRDIFIKRRGCTGRCSQEPIVTVEHPGALPIHYHNAPPQLCKEIFSSHVLSGIPVSSAIVDIECQPEQTHCWFSVKAGGVPISFQKIFGS